MSTRIIIQSVLGLILLTGGAVARAQEPLPITISPLQVERDPNGVNLITGKIELGPPALAVPGAPNLRFERLQNAAPYVSGSQSGTSIVHASYSVHTNTGTSESFRCIDFQCQGLTYTGSTFVTGTAQSTYTRGGSGEIYRFDLKHVRSGTSPETMLYYASSVTYPNGEVITYTYDTATVPGDPLQRTYYRPTQVSSSLGYFITISYHLATLGSTNPAGLWSAPYQVAIYRTSEPSQALGRLTYSSDGTTITDLGGRVFTCTGCATGLYSNIEQHSGSLRLPGEASNFLQVTPHPTREVVASVTRDGVVWNYTYTNLRYNTAGRGGEWFDRVTVTGPNGYNVAYDMRNWDGGNVITQITDSLGRVTAVDFDFAQRPIRIELPEDNALDVVYDGIGNLRSRTSQPKPGSGLSATIETAEFPGGTCAIATNDYPISCFRPSWHRDGLNRQTDFLYNTKGQLTERTDPADAFGVRRKTYVTYETSTGISRPSVVRVCGDVTTCNTADEIRTEYQYWGNTRLPSLVRRVDAARGETRETRFTYDLAGRVLSEDGPLPGTADATYFRYDVLGRKTWEIGPADIQGRRQATQLWPRQADDKITASEQGWVPNETSTTMLDARRVDITYYRRNPVLEALSAGGSTYTVTQRDFDHRGQLTCETRRMNPGTFTAPPSSACTLGTEGSFGPDRITRHTYDAAGQLLLVQRAYGTSVQQNYATYTYTTNGRRQTIKDANSNLTTLEYDGFDRLAKMRFPVATSGANQSSTTDYEQYGYDTVGNRTTLRKRDGKTITFAYDALNRVRLKTVPTSTSGAPGYSVYYGYDVRGLQLFARFSSTSGAGVTNTYDGFGGLRSSSTNLDGVTRSVVSDYDAQGNRSRITHPDSAYFEYRYDPAGRLTQLTENGPSTRLALLTYDSQGRRDAIGRDTAGAATGFGYDTISRLGAIVHNLDGAATGNDLTTTFSYNPASQIVTRAQSNNAYEFPVASSNHAYVTNGRNQYTQITGDAPATLSWDTNGNLTSDGSTTFGYDTENRLVSASGAKNATLTYDPLGRLYQVTSGGVTTRFVYDGDRLIAEYNTAGTVQRRYVHGAAVDEPLVWYEGSAVSSATRRYLHTDHQGSIVAASNATGSTQNIGTYDAYGVTTAPSTWRFQYTGQAAIPPLGLYYYKARFYNPALGRFMQTDPIGYEDDNNLYAYVGNDPLNSTDPSGEWGLPGAFFGAIAGATGGFIASGDSVREKFVGTISGAVAGGVVGLVAPQTSQFAGMAVAGAVASAAGQAIGSTANAAIDKGVENVGLSDVNVSATTTVAGGLGAGAGGIVSKGVASMTAQPIVGNTVQAAGAPTATGLTAGAVAEGATIGAAERMAPAVVETANRIADELKRQINGK